jgi:hypothetical protein
MMIFIITPSTRYLEIRWHSATIAARVLPVSVPTSAFGRIPIALHAS